MNDVRIPRVRRCKNPYRNCQNFALKQTGNAYEDKICAECLQRRREKQSQTARQPNCKCGNKCREGHSYCSTCERRAEEAAQPSTQELFEDEIRKEIGELKRLIGH